MKQTLQEMKGLTTNKIDFLINEGEAMGYVYIGIKTKDSPDGMSKIHGATKLYAPPEMHDYMTKNVKLLGGLFNNMYKKIVILHDPTLPMAKEESKKISNQDKGKIKSMVKDGISVEDIAKELALDLDKVEEYANKL